MNTKILCFLTQFLLLKVNYTKSVMESFIVGGLNTNILSYPHSVFLEMNCDGIWICGSAIINQRILLTVAHCFEGCTKKGLHTVRAYAGSENIMEVNILRPVTTLLMHSGYDTEEALNDIALGAIEHSLPLGNTMKRVIIMRSFPSTRAGTVAGWGLTDDSDSFSTTLKSLQQIIKSKAHCARIGNMHPGMFCAGVVANLNEYPSYGDSGSAFITKQYQQLGIVSFRVERYPTLTVYSNVSYYYSWIKANTKQMICYKRSKKFIQL